MSNNDNNNEIANTCTYVLHVYPWNYCIIVFKCDVIISITINVPVKFSTPAPSTPTPSP